MATVMTAECIVPVDRKFDKDGYPRIKIKGRTWRMNRWMWKVTKGDIPDNKVVAHSCNNKGCINPHHFYLTSTEENSKDAKRDSLYRSGNSHPNNKISTDDWPLIKDMYERGLSQKKVGNYFGISQSRVSSILKKDSNDSI